LGGGISAGKWKYAAPHIDGRCFLAVLLLGMFLAVPVRNFRTARY
jgi:hypothetical protein